MRSTACPRARRERRSRRSPGRNPVAHRANASARADETPAARDPAPGAASRSTVVTTRPGARRDTRACVWLVERRDASHERRDVSSGSFRALGAHVFSLARAANRKRRTHPVSSSTGGCHRWPRSPPRPPRVYRREAGPPGPARGTYANRPGFAPRVAAPRRAKAQIVLGFGPSATLWTISSRRVPPPRAAADAVSLPLSLLPAHSRSSCALRASSSPVASSALAQSTITSSACA